MSQVRYFVPEDGDTELTPNVFLAPKPARPGYPPLLGQIKKSFPLPGTYHFRFKTTLVPGHERGPIVWMDVEDNNEPVPALQNVIFAKVTRVSFENEDEFESDNVNYGHHANKATDGVPSASMPMKKDHPYARSAPPSVSNTPSHTPRSTPTPNLSSHGNGDVDLLGGGFGGSNERTTSTRTAESRGNSASLLDGFDESGASVPVSSPSESLLDMPQSSPTAPSSTDHDFFGTSTSHPEPVRAHTTSHHNDFLGMHAPAPSNPVPNISQQMPGSNNMTRGPSGGGYGNSMNYRSQSNGQPYQPAQTSAPNSGNAMKAQNAFDTFSKKSSPFSDFGNFA